MVSEDAKGYDKLDNCLGEDFLARGHLDPVSVRSHPPHLVVLDVNTESSVRLRGKVSRSVKSGALSREKWCRCNNAIIAIVCIWLHIRMRLFEEKERHYNRQEEQPGTDQIWEKIGECCEDPSSAEQPRKVLSGLSKIAANRSCTISTK